MFPLARPLRELLTGAAVTTEERAAFGVWCAGLTLLSSRVLAISTLTLVLLAWPSDLVVFAGQPEALARMAMWRVGLATIAGVFVVITWRMREATATRWLLPAMSTGLVLTGVFCGYALAAMGDLSTPYFYGIYTLAGLALFFFVPLPTRVVLTFLFTGSYLVGYFGSFPAYATSPSLPFGLLVLGFADLVYVGIGHWIYLLTQRNFLQQRALERQSIEIDDARARSDRLLLNVLPSAVAERLKGGADGIADRHDEVTVLFADIVGFTQLASALRPEEVVEFLNRLFSEFDALADAHGLEKIKTIGDCYMVAGGLPDARPDHAEAICEMGLGMLDAAERTVGPGGARVALRVGVATGPVVAGVIGSRKFIYDLWGDTVNTASRMESHGVVGRVQITAATRDRLDGRYLFEEREPVEVKGKGRMRTWVVTGRVAQSSSSSRTVA